MRALGTNTKSGEITSGMEYFLATGNLRTKNGLGLMQTNGLYVLIYKNLANSLYKMNDAMNILNNYNHNKNFSKLMNYCRILHHCRAPQLPPLCFSFQVFILYRSYLRPFVPRAIHRGAFFTEMRTTEVRKLRPEAWGFICPVHTPDGAPCGLLNHVLYQTLFSIW